MPTILPSPPTGQKLSEQPVVTTPPADARVALVVPSAAPGHQNPTMLITDLVVQLPADLAYTNQLNGFTVSPTVPVATAPTQVPQLSQIPVAGTTAGTYAPGNDSRFSASGQNGWTPVFAAVTRTSDGATVLQIVDWARY